MQSDRQGFYHRRHIDGTYVSICYNCFLATGSAETEGQADLRSNPTDRTRRVSG
jgi:hypothetical protein